MKRDRSRFLILTIGAAIGLVAAFMQTIEKLVLLENKEAILPCNLNDIFNCSTVLSAPQSSLFGFPNSLICIMIFTLLLTVGIVGMTKSRMTRKFLFGMQALAFFMLLFALWFLFTSTYVIGAICVFCLICFAGLLLINAALWRLNFSSDQMENKISRFLQALREKNFDILLWLSLAVLMAATIIQRFYI
ncbi:MAG TPA: vitamin K epoxide reductase family protein [Candidatus Saccharimonadales bacterium]|nr:vitamin K epoxide reductase family protein [Candidatus Saccharimonadales bacterium]